MGITRNRWLIATGLVLGLAGPVQASTPPGPGKTYASDFGLSSGLFATGSTISVTYFGWESSTVFGHTLFAMTASEYNTDKGLDCFQFYQFYRASCLALQGDSLFAKRLGAADYSVPGSPPTVGLAWANGEEIIFALRVYQGDGTGDSDPKNIGPQYNWFFSGDPTRNEDHLGHLAFFAPPVYESGVPGDGEPILGTGGRSIFGFEDVIYQNSDWDFNNALFALNGTSGPTELVPEPVTLTLLATGLAGLGALRRRRRRSDSAPG